LFGRSVPQRKETGIISVQGIDVHYILRSSTKARRIQLKIMKEGKLEIVVPHRIDINEGKRFLALNIAWVEKHLEHLKPRQKQYLYAGKSYKPVAIPEQGRKLFSCRLHEDGVHIFYPAESKESPHEIFLKFLRLNAHKILPKRCTELAGMHGFVINKISVRGQRSRWGSCSRRKNISLNYRLLQFRPEMIDYVIIHELCHLRHPNHSKAFWNEVAKYIPNYKLLDKELNSIRLF